MKQRMRHYHLLLYFVFMLTSGSVDGMKSPSNADEVFQSGESIAKVCRALKIAVTNLGGSSHYLADSFFLTRMYKIEGEMDGVRAKILSSLRQSLDREHWKVESTQPISEDKNPWQFAFTYEERKGLPPREGKVVITITEGTKSIYYIGVFVHGVR